MKKITVLFASVILVICLCGCLGTPFESGAEKTEDTRKTVDLTDDTAVQNDDAGNGLYYANKKTKKFHRSSCTAAEKMNNDNLYITDSRDELIQSGYAPCSVCEP